MTEHWGSIPLHTRLRVKAGSLAFRRARMAATLKKIRPLPTEKGMLTSPSWRTDDEDSPASLLPEEASDSVRLIPKGLQKYR